MPDDSSRWRNELSLSEVYGSGVRLGMDTSFYQDSICWEPMEDVDWDRDIQVPEEQEQALITVATQFHFGNMADLMLCGRIMEHEQEMEAKRLALLLSTAKIRSVDAWGRYLDKLQGATEITPSLKKYMDEMYNDATDTLSLLIGMSIIGDVSGRIILEQAMTTDEPVLSEMAECMTAQTRKNQENAKHYLKIALSNTHPNRLTKVRNDVLYYRRNLADIILSQQDAFETLGWNPDYIASRAAQDADEFLNAIVPDN